MCFKKKIIEKDLLLYVCCAPCALPVLEYFKNNLKDRKVTMFFYNPNIFPKKEYFRRLKMVKKIARIYKVNLIVGAYDRENWLNYLKFKLTKPLESYQENGERCGACFYWRISKAFEMCKEMGFKEITTTLETNLHKDVILIKQIKEELSSRTGVNIFDLSLDRQELYNKGIELCKKYNIYRQKYCGCKWF